MKIADAIRSARSDILPLMWRPEVIRQYRIMRALELLGVPTPDAVKATSRTGGFTQVVRQVMAERSRSAAGSPACCKSPVR